MNEEKDFFKTCFNTVAGLEVKNESQAIAKEIVLSEIENLQQENQELKKIVELYSKSLYNSELAKHKEVIDKVRKLIEKHYYKESDDYYDYFTEGVCLQDGDYNELLDILKEVSE